MIGAELMRFWRSCGRRRGGCWVFLQCAPSPEAVEILGWAGLDFVIIDAEHGPADLETVTNMVRGAEASRDYALSFASR